MLGCEATSQDIPIGGFIFRFRCENVVIISDSRSTILSKNLVYLDNVAGS